MDLKLSKNTKLFLLALSVATNVACGSFKPLTETLPTEEVSEQEESIDTLTRSGSISIGEARQSADYYFVSVFVAVRNTGTESWNAGTGTNVNVKFDCNDQNRSTQYLPNNFRQGAQAGLTANFFCPAGSRVTVHLYHSSHNYIMTSANYDLANRPTPTPVPVAARYTMEFRFDGGSCDITSNGSAIGATSTVVASDRLSLSNCTAAAGRITPPQVDSPCNSSSFTISQNTVCNVRFGTTSSSGGGGNPPNPTPTPTPTPVVQTSGSLTVCILNNGLPIQGVTITANGPYNGSGQTEANGCIGATVPFGDYVLSASLNGVSKSTNIRHDRTGRILTYDAALDRLTSN